MPFDELGLNIPTVLKDLGGANIRLWTQILNNGRDLGIPTHAPLPTSGSQIP
jgi:hypothetical protein